MFSVRKDSAKFRLSEEKANKFAFLSVRNLSKPNEFVLTPWLLGFLAPCLLPLPLGGVGGGFRGFQGGSYTKTTVRGFTVPHRFI